MLGARFKGPVPGAGKGIGAHGLHAIGLESGHLWESTPTRRVGTKVLACDTRPNAAR